MPYRTCRILLTAILTAGVMAALQPVQPASAALTVLSVDTTAQRNSAGDLLANCTLGDAIVAANNDAPEDGCTHANIGTGGPFEIVLAASATYTLNSVDNVTDGENGLPSVSSTITILGNGATVTRGGAATFRIFHMAATGNLTLDNLTVSNGVADDLGTGARGGGIFNRGTLIIQNGSMISHNQATAWGGGFYNTSAGTVEVLSDSQITSNLADFGGGIMTDGDRVTIDASTVSNNTADYGGGLFNRRTDVTITNSIIDSNIATISAGGIWNDSTLLNVRNSTFSSNRAATDSGAIYSYTNSGLISTVNVENSTFSGNTASNGAAIRNNGINGDVRVFLNNVTIFGNSATMWGGGLCNSHDIGSTATIEYTNSIIAGNNAPTGPDCYLDAAPFPGTATSNGNNLFTTAGNFGGGGPNDCGAAGSDIVVPTVPDLYLAPLANYGGPTETHALLFDSPAIDAGNNGTCVAGGDQRGEPRIDRDGSGVATCDIGAYEYAPALAFATQPGCADANDPLNPQPVVRFVDPNSGSVTDTNVNGTNNITMSLVPPAGGATLNGTNPQPFVAGLSTFTDLSVDLDGTYQLRATANMLGLAANTLDSGPFNIPCAPAPASAPSSSGGPAPIIAVSDPAISKLGAPDNAAIGETVVWTIIVSNPGAVPTGAVFVSDPIPDTLDIVNVTTTRGTTSTAGQVVTVDVGILAPGESVTITIETVGNLLAQPGEVCNTAAAGNVTAVDCVTLFPDTLPATGGQPIRTVSWIWWVMVGLVVTAFSSGWLLSRKGEPGGGNEQYE
jgi:uncharacterized repeat protein (TIGR01451 family)